MADSVLDWDDLGLLNRYKTGLTLTDGVAWALLYHIGKVCRGTGLVPQFHLCNLTTALAWKAPFTLRCD